MAKSLIDITDKYQFERIYEPNSNKGIRNHSENLETFFVHKGTAEINLKLKNGEDGHFHVSSGQGFIIGPDIFYSIDNKGEFVAYNVSSEVDKNKPIVEIIDDGNSRNFVELKDYKLINSPKKVVKPWGQELWISWFRDYHVMKQISMNSGNKSSLQFHRTKLETNYLEKGRAEVIDGYKLNPNSSEQEVLESSKGINFDIYKKKILPGMHWTSYPGTVHRVIAEEDYIAYEVSTPELDDVIRLEDDNQRKSGRVDSEHTKNKNGK